MTVHSLKPAYGGEGDYSPFELIVKVALRFADGSECVYGKSKVEQVEKGACHCCTSREFLLFYVVIQSRQAQLLSDTFC